jgi:predicted N-acetyltransferase YhbS
MKWQIRNERAEDAAAIEKLVIATFGAGRFAKTAYRLREGVMPIAELSFVAVDDNDGTLLGSVQFCNIDIGGTPSLLLGPLAVQPELRGKGIGITLMRRGIEEARALGHESVILVGDEPYYAKVGFSRLPPRRLIMPGPVDPTRLLGLSLKPGALLNLSGEVRRAHIDIPVSAQATPLP